MTPQEKAIELFDKMYMTGIDEYNSKLCALIAVEEILICCIGSHEEYWQEVKQEIEKL
jgi:hypothetical protein